MATVAVIFGGMAGFVAALAALLLFNASWLVALALWSLGGLAVTGLLATLAMTGRQTQEDLVAKHA